MCGRFIFIPEDELQRIIADVKMNIQAQQYQNVASYAHNVYPKADVPIIVPDGNRLEVEVMRWGVEKAWAKTPLFNTRCDTASASKPNGQPSIWADSLSKRRCLVPTYGFYEPHKKDTHPSPKTGKPIKDQYLFRLPGSTIVMLAGIYEANNFTIMTTEPNHWMEPIHNRMPIVLRPEELETWLYGNYSELFDRSNIVLEIEKESA